MVSTQPCIQSENIPVPPEGYVLIRFIANGKGMKICSKPGTIADLTKPRPLRIQIENSALEPHLCSIEKGEFVDTYIPCRIVDSETAGFQADTL
jgi:hypothetical protein